VIRRLVSYSHVSPQHIDFEMNHWTAQGYEPRRGSDGVFVYECRPQDEMLTTPQAWQRELEADLRELVGGRSDEFYEQMRVNKEAAEGLMAEVEKIEWLIGLVKTMQRPKAEGAAP